MNTDDDNISKILIDNTAKIKQALADIKAKQDSGISLTTEELNAIKEMPMILRKMGELTYLLEKYQTVVSMCTKAHITTPPKKQDTTTLTFELANSDDQAPKNWCIFANNETMSGPMGFDIAARKLELLNLRKELNDGDLLKSWEADSRPIPNEYQQTYRRAMSRCGCYHSEAIDNHQELVPMHTKAHGTTSLEKPDMTGLTFELITMSNGEYRAPKNWFIFLSNGTMAGPMTRGIAEQELAILEEKDETTLLKSWEIDNRPIPEEYHHVFRTAFGFLPDASNKGES